MVSAITKKIAYVLQPCYNPPWRPNEGHLDEARAEKDWFLLFAGSQFQLKNESEKKIFR
jgi:hypothetical protein